MKSSGLFEGCGDGSRFVSFPRWIPSIKKCQINTCWKKDFCWNRLEAIVESPKSAHTQIGGGYTAFLPGLGPFQEEGAFLKISFRAFGFWKMEISQWLCEEKECKGEWGGPMVGCANHLLNEQCNVVKLLEKRGGRVFEKNHMESAMAI